MALMTAQDMRNLLERSQEDTLPTLEDNTFLDFADWFNQEVYPYLYNVNPEDYITEQIINVIAGTDTYAITGDLDNIKTKGCGLYEENKDYSLPETKYNSIVKGFYLKGTNLILTPEPALDDTLTFRNVQVVATLTAMSDITLIDKRFSAFIKDSINTSFYEWSDNGKEIGSSQRVQSSFRQFVRRIQKSHNIYTLNAS